MQIKSASGAGSAHPPIDFLGCIEDGGALHRMADDCHCHIMSDPPDDRLPRQ